MKVTIPALSTALTLLACAAIGLSQQKEGSAPGDPATMARAFVEKLAAGDFEGATKQFDATMTAAMPQEGLRAVWAALNAQAGAFKGQTGVRTEKAKQYDVVFVTCAFEKASLDAKVVYDSAGQVAGLFFVPTRPPAAQYVHPAYAAPDRFGEKVMEVGAGTWALPGTLTLPAGLGPFPALVLVHGSGPHDRDETIGPNRPFRDLAEGLGSRGIAVLRYEKRTRAHAAGMAATMDSLTVKEETVDDALAAVSLLRHMEGIDGRRIFVLGHSLGGMLIPRMGACDSGIAGLIVMAGTTRPLEDVVLDQMSYLFALDGSLSDAEARQLEKVREQVKAVKGPGLSPTTPSSALPLGLPAGYWLDLRGYHPPEMAASLNRPMLILQGERDYQVTMEDFKGWQQALSDRKNVVLKSYPKLNHLFVEGEGKSSPRDYEASGHVAAAVVDEIAGWIKRQ